MQAISPQLHGKCFNGEDLVQIVWGAAGLTNIGRYFLWKWKISFEMFLLKYWGTSDFPLLLIFQANRMKLTLTTFSFLSNPIFIAFPKLPQNTFSCGQYRKRIGNYIVNLALPPKVWEGEMAKLLSDNTARWNPWMKHFLFLALLEVLTV